MERRTAIKNLFIIAGGIAILKSCTPGKNKASIELKKIDVSADQEALLAEFVEVLIPETTTPGAKSLGLHLFVLKMVDDCHDAEDQKKFMAGLTALNQQSFQKAAADERKKIVETIRTSSDAPGFFDIVRRRTLQGYMNSKYVMTELIPYELVPSRYNGFFPVKKS
jgi:hypothetical protein